MLGNLCFSLLVSGISTIIYVAYYYKDNCEKIKQEHAILFGIIFITSFIIKTLYNSKNLPIIRGGNSGMTNTIVATNSYSSRPPF